MGSGGAGLLETRWPLPLLLLLIMGEWGPLFPSPCFWIHGWIHGLDPSQQDKKGSLVSLLLISSGSTRDHDGGGGGGVWLCVRETERAM